MGAPERTGDRLAVVFGHSLATEAFADRGKLVRVQGVELLDCGDYVALGRHGHTTFTPAHGIDHRYHVAALAAAGCGRIVGLGSVGSLRRDWDVGSVVVPDDFLAPQVNPTFFEGAEGHRVPGFDTTWRSTIVTAWERAANGPLIDGGVYAQTVGPRFETPAEVRLLADYADLVGMTIASEAILAGEAGLAYAAVCSVDNLANGLDVAPLTVEQFRENKARNEARMAAAVDALVDQLLEISP